MNRKDSFIRWQEIRVRQFGFVNYLLILLSSALLSFQLKYIIEGINLTYYLAVYFNTSMILMIFSTIIGVTLSYNRLCLFKKTCKIAKMREDKKLEITENDRTITIGKLRDETNNFHDVLSWILIKWQMITFSIGVLFLLFMVTGFKIPCIFN